MLAKRLVLGFVIFLCPPVQAFDVKPGLWKVEQVGGGESDRKWTTEFCRTAKYTSDILKTFRAALEYSGFGIEDVDDKGNTVYLTVADGSLDPPLVLDLTLKKYSDEHFVYTNESRDDVVDKYVEDHRWLSDDC